jgi:hypothetical protein
MVKSKRRSSTSSRGAADKSAQLLKDLKERDAELAKARAIIDRRLYEEGRRNWLNPDLSSSATGIATAIDELRRELQRGRADRQNQPKQPEPTSEKARKQRKRKAPEVDRLIAELQQIYAPNGLPPPGQEQKVTIGDILNWRAAHNDKQKTVAPRTLGRALEQIQEKLNCGS